MYYPGIFDTHAHYDDPRFADDLDGVMARQRAHGVRYIINAASDLASARQSLQLAERYDIVYAAVGVHPHDAAGLPGDWLAQLEALATHPKAVAIGEIGLDYYYDTPSRDVQKEVFCAQLELAGRLGMPVQIHDRDAHGDIMDMLRQYKPSGCLHRYSGSPEMAREAVKLGMVLGIGGALTYNNAKKERAVVEQIPLEHLILETDCPYLAPQQFRGKMSTSDMLWVVADLIAALKGDVTPQQVVDTTTRTAKRVFGIK